MPRKPTYIELQAWQPYLRKRGGAEANRQMYRDVDREEITLHDQFGITIYPAAELPGRLLKYAMLEGLCLLLRLNGDPRTVWQAWKAGKIPTHLKPAPHTHARKKAKRPVAPLGKARLAIVAALGDQPHCTASVAEREAYVRKLTQEEVAMWNREPDVKLHYRSIMGQPSLRTAELVEQVNALAEQMREPPPAPEPEPPAGPPKKKRGRPPKSQPPTNTQPV